MFWFRQERHSETFISTAEKWICHESQIYRRVRRTEYTKAHNHGFAAVKCFFLPGRLQVKYWIINKRKY